MSAGMMMVPTPGAEGRRVAAGAACGRELDDAATIFQATGVRDRAKRVGEAAPDVALHAADGALVRLSSLWRKGPVVLVFFRGGWCTYCNEHLRRWQAHLSELEALGTTLVAVSPQSVDNMHWTASGNALQYQLLSDSSLAAANGFDIAFTLPAELIDLYASVGTNVPVLNGNGLWVLPVPATYVIDRHGHIAYAHVEADYRERAEPTDVIAAVRTVLEREKA